MVAQTSLRTPFVDERRIRLAPADHTQVNAHEPIVLSALRGVTLIDKVDAAQAGRMALVEARLRFDPRLGVPFGAFARRRVLGAVRRTHYRERRERAQWHAHANQILYERGTETPAHRGGVSEAQYQAVRSFVDQLPPRLKLVARRVFWDGMPKQEVAAELGVAPSSISKMLESIKRLGQVQLSELAA